MLTRYAPRTVDLANAANHSSIEQRDLERYIKTGDDTGTDTEEAGKSPPFTPDSVTAGTDDLGTGFGNWPTTWEEIKLDPLEHGAGDVAGDAVQTALQEGEDLGEVLLQQRCVPYRSKLVTNESATVRALFFICV